MLPGCQVQPHPAIKNCHMCPRQAWVRRRAENCIVVAEGMLGHNGVMRVNALGFPPVEPRAESQAAAKARRRPAWGHAPGRLEACRSTCTHKDTS